MCDRQTALRRRDSAVRPGIPARLFDTGQRLHPPIAERTDAVCASRRNRFAAAAMIFACWPDAASPRTRIGRWVKARIWAAHIRVQSLRMTPPRPPAFAAVADGESKGAYLFGHPEVVEWLSPGTKLFKWTQSITTSRGVSPWWQFVEARRLATGATCPGIRELREYAARLGVHDRDYTRVRAAVTEQWNKMTHLVAIELVRGSWGYVGKASGQLEDNSTPGVYWIGGEYQVWIPGLLANDIRRISLPPYRQPNPPFGAR
jgi:hypothetical protein